MKVFSLKRFFVLVVALLLISLSVFASSATSVSLNHIYDNAGLLTTAQISELEADLAKKSESLQRDIAIITVSDLGGYSSSEDYAEALYSGFDIGYGDTNNGVLLLICFDGKNGDAAVYAQGECSKEITASDIDNTVLPEIGDALRSHNFPEACRSFARVCEEEISSYGKFNLKDFLIDLGISLVIGIVIALIVVFVMKGQLKSVRFEAAANNYVKEDSFNLVIQRDIFLYRTVTRVARPKDSGSSSSKGGSSSGSMKF